MNKKREQQNLPPIRDPMVTGTTVASGADAQATPELEPDPRPSVPVDNPKSEVAKKALDTPETEAKSIAADKPADPDPAESIRRV